MPTVFEFETFPGRRLVACVVRGCIDVDSVAASIATEALPVSLIDARLLATPFCLQIAAHRVLHAQLTSVRQRIASQHADLLCALLGVRGTADAHRVLGPRAGCRDVLVAAFDPPADLLNSVVARLGSADAPLLLDSFYPVGADAPAIIAAYNIPPAEAAALDPLALALEAAVLGRVALQDTVLAA